jgi:hypothetical protein
MSKRCDTGLMAATINLIVYFVANDFFIDIKDASIGLAVPVRKLYDVLNVLQSIDIVLHCEKGQYVFNPRYHLLALDVAEKAVEDHIELAISMFQDCPDVNVDDIKSVTTGITLHDIADIPDLTSLLPNL